MIRVPSFDLYLSLMTMCVLCHWNVLNWVFRTTFYTNSWKLECTRSIKDVNLGILCLWLFSCSFANCFLSFQKLVKFIDRFLWGDWVYVTHSERVEMVFKIFTKHFMISGIHRRHHFGCTVGTKLFSWVKESYATFHLKLISKFLHKRP